MLSFFLFFFWLRRFSNGGEKNYFSSAAAARATSTSTTTAQERYRTPPPPPPTPSSQGHCRSGGLGDRFYMKMPYRKKCNSVIGGIRNRSRSGAVLLRCVERFKRSRTFASLKICSFEYICFLLACCHQNRNFSFTIFGGFFPGTAATTKTVPFAVEKSPDSGRRKANECKASQARAFFWGEKNFEERKRERKKKCETISLSLARSLAICRWSPPLHESPLCPFDSKKNLEARKKKKMKKASTTSTSTTITTTTTAGCCFCFCRLTSTA